jgi:hypothetical protein
MGGRSSKLTRAVLRLERRVMTWPLPVGLARVLGVLGLFGAGVQLTCPLVVVPPSMTSLHAALLAATVLGSVALAVTPSSTLTRANSRTS